MNAALWQRNFTSWHLFLLSHVFHKAFILIGFDDLLGRARENEKWGWAVWLCVGGGAHPVLQWWSDISQASGFGSRSCTNQQETTSSDAQTSTERLLKQFKRSHIVNLCERRRDGKARVMGERSEPAKRLSIQPTRPPCLASITIKSRPLRALIVRRYISHPISLSPVKHRHAFIRIFFYFSDIFITGKAVPQPLKFSRNPRLSSFKCIILLDRNWHLHECKTECLRNKYLSTCAQSKGKWLTVFHSICALRKNAI